MKAHKHTDDTRLALLEQSIGTINQTLIRMEQRFERLETKMDTGFSDVNKRLDNMNGRFDIINNRIWTNFLWLLLFYASTIGVTLSGVYYMINS